MLTPMHGGHPDIIAAAHEQGPFSPSSIRPRTTGHWKMASLRLSGHIRHQRSGRQRVLLCERVVANFPSVSRSVRSIAQEMASWLHGTAARHRQAAVVNRYRKGARFGSQGAIARIGVYPNPSNSACRLLCKQCFQWLLKNSINVLLQPIAIGINHRYCIGIITLTGPKIELW